MPRQGRMVGIRELRQKLRLYLKRAAAGETFQVTDRGRAVAILAPLPKRFSALQQLIASGRASAPAGDLLELGAPRARRLSKRASKMLQQLRSDRF